MSRNACARAACAFCDGGKPIRRVAVGGGACGKLMDFALAKGADAFVIGDCSYDLMQRAQSLGPDAGRRGPFPDRKPGCGRVCRPHFRRFPAGAHGSVRAPCGLHSVCVRKNHYAIRCDLPWGSGQMNSTIRWQAAALKRSISPTGTKSCCRRAGRAAHAACCFRSPQARPRAHFNRQPRAKTPPRRPCSACCCASMCRGRRLRLSPSLRSSVCFRIELDTTDEMGVPCKKHLIVELMGKHSNVILCGRGQPHYRCAAPRGRRPVRQASGAARAVLPHAAPRRTSTTRSPCRARGLRPRRRRRTASRGWTASCWASCSAFRRCCARELSYRATGGRSKAGRPDDSGRAAGARPRV